ncbi:receptor-transporting protein 3-like [Hyla sarda]|uniref:receptor-transporting protein 3-like n=1 Tax=Hyla sarda TaxID=327740 RepID=UPI0024C3D589|nr:receptor-transporting protein 3-like [Hyla sarda]
MDEDTWKEAFENEIENRDILHSWSLDIEERFEKHQGWLQYTLCSFARFCCQLCDRRWASSKVHILFQIKLWRTTGQVKMHIFKQKCKLCNAGYYEIPMFIPENIEIAMSMLVNRICEKFYNMPKENMLSKSFIKDGRQDGPHDSSNCEGCAQGICNRNLNRNQGFPQSFPRLAFHGIERQREESHRTQRFQNNRYSDRYDQGSSDSLSNCNCCVIL